MDRVLNSRELSFILTGLTRKGAALPLYGPVAARRRHIDPKKPSRLEHSTPSVLLQPPAKAVC